MIGPGERRACRDVTLDKASRQHVRQVEADSGMRADLMSPQERGGVPPAGCARRTMSCVARTRSTRSLSSTTCRPAACPSSDPRRRRAHPARPQSPSQAPDGPASRPANSCGRPPGRSGPALQQQHRPRPRFREACCDNAARSPAAHDDRVDDFGSCHGALAPARGVQTAHCLPPGSQNKACQATQMASPRAPPPCDSHAASWRRTAARALRSPGSSSLDRRFWSSSRTATGSRTTLVTVR